MKFQSNERISSDPKSITMGAEQSAPAKFRLFRCGLDRLTIAFFPSSENRYINFFKFMEQISAGNLPKVCQIENSEFQMLQGKFSIFIPAQQGTCYLYQYGIMSEDCAFDMAHPKAWRIENKTPPILFRPSKEFIYNKGLEGVSALVSQITEQFKLERHHITYLELCADFTGWKPNNDDIAKHRFRCRAKCHRPLAVEGDVPEIIQFGKRKAFICAVLYDKTKECRKKGEEWLLERIGCKLTDDVWRLEFRLSRDGLRQIHLNTLEDLGSRIANLWAYLTKEWLVHSRGKKPSTTWRQLQYAFGEAPLLKREASCPQSAQHKKENLFRQCAGYAALASHISIQDVLNDLSKYNEGRPDYFSELLERNKMKSLY